MTPKAVVSIRDTSTSVATMLRTEVAKESRMEPVLQPPLGHFCLKAFKVLVLECVTDTAVLENKPSQLLRCQSTEPAHPTWHLDGVRRARDSPPLEQHEGCCHLSPTKAAVLCLLEYSSVRKCNEWINKHIKTSGQEGAQGVVRLSLVQLCFKIGLFKAHIG